MASITLFDAFVLLISIPSEISILSYSHIYNSYKESSKKICGYYSLFSSKTDLAGLFHIHLLQWACIPHHLLS